MIAVNTRKTNVFIHTIEDVDHFVDTIKDDRKDFTIYSSHPGVFEYARNKCTYDVVLLTLLISNKEVDDIRTYSKEHSTRLLNNMDLLYANAISSRFGINNMNIFVPLHIYTLHVILTGLLVFKTIFLKIVNYNHNNEFIIYDFTDNYYGVFSLKEFMFDYLKSCKVKVIWIDTIKYRKKVSVKNLIIKAIKNPFKARDRILNIYYTYRSFKSNSKNTILYMDGLYDLSFLKKDTTFKFIPYDYNSLTHKYTNKQSSVTYDIEDIFKYDIDKYDYNEIYILKQVIKSFIINTNHYAVGLKELDLLLNKENIKLAIWGNPPILGFKSLFYEYCNIKNVRIVGMQHGSSYIDQHIESHFISDFSRCNDYISYGFTQSDLEYNFNNVDTSCVKIHPLGSTNLGNTKKVGKIIDILFPVSNTISLFDGCFEREYPDKLHSDQKNILNILERTSESGISVLIKPFADTTIWQTSVYCQLQNLQSVTVEYQKSLNEILNEVLPKCVIIEIMSTPLYEIISMDVEIILFVRETDKVTNKALGMLNKRVHIVKNINEFYKVFEKYIDGNLCIKRDNSYQNYYVRKDRTKEKIISLLSKSFQIPELPDY
jgi:hypothetical protein